MGAHVRPPRRRSTAAGAQVRGDRLRRKLLRRHVRATVLPGVILLMVDVTMAAPMMMVVVVAV